MAFVPGEVLDRAQLRFSRSSPQARHDDARRGLRMHGPYDWSTLGKDRVSAIVVCPRPLSQAADTLVSALTGGTGYFPGFQEMFRVPLRVTGKILIDNETPGEIEQAIRQAVVESPDIVYLVTEARNDTLYSAAKGLLLGNGVPSQVVTAAKLIPGDQLQWIVENIALASYAKVGGTPWVVAAKHPVKEVVIGVSRVQDRSGSMIVGIVTMFTQDGDFLLSDYLAPKPLAWDTDAYVSGLADLIATAYLQYERDFGKPENVVVHLCKRPGKLHEVEAAVQAVHSIGTPVPFALVHLNDDTNFRLFDTGQSHCVPPAGLCVQLGPQRSLVLLDGLVHGRRVRRGVPTTLEVSLDKRSTFSREAFPRLVQQVADFSRVNWRGFNAYASPASLNYSYLIAKMISEVGISRWNEIAASGRLRDKAWFL
jgi:hypothetical protein